MPHDARSDKDYSGPVPNCMAEHSHSSHALTPGSNCLHRRSKQMTSAATTMGAIPRIAKAAYQRHYWCDRRQQFSTIADVYLKFFVEFTIAHISLVSFLSTNVLVLNYHRWGCCKFSGVKWQQPQIEVGFSHGPVACKLNLQLFWAKWHSKYFKNNAS